MVAIAHVPVELQSLARMVDGLADVGNGNEELDPAELLSARDVLVRSAEYKTPERRAELRKLTELLLPLHPTPPPSSGTDLDDVDRPRTIGRGGRFESVLHPAEPKTRREDITFMTPQNPSGLKLEPNKAAEVPRQLVSGSVIAVNIKVDPSSRAVVRAKMEGAILPPWTGSRTADLVPYYGPMTLESDAPAVVRAIEVVYSPHANLPSPDESGDLQRLNDTQRAVVQDVETKARARSEAARAALVSRVEGMGFSERDLDLTLDYIATIAPVAIHFRPDKSLQVMNSRVGDPNAIVVDRGKKLIDAFLADKFYKNQFETGITGGSASAYEGGSRDGWEKKIFENGYHGHPLVASERPKYAAMNGSWQPTGPATHYGDSYVILKRGIRNRTTFTPSDSSSCSAADVGTANHIQHVLLKLDETRLRGIIQAALGYDARAQHTYSYLEAQIHGPIDFSKDIQRVVIHDALRGTEYETKIRQWAVQNGFAVSWHDKKEIHVDGELPSASPPLAR